jgi:hypothetical protein
MVVCQVTEGLTCLLFVNVFFFTLLCALDFNVFFVFYAVDVV